MELDGVRARKWNFDKVIVIQSVILKHSQGVNNYKHILACILLQLDCWNCGAFNELAEDTFNACMGYLGKACRIQTEDQRHQMLSNLVLKGNFMRH